MDIIWNKKILGYSSKIKCQQSKSKNKKINEGIEFKLNWIRSNEGLFIFYEVLNNKWKIISKVISRIKKKTVTETQIELYSTGMDALRAFNICKMLN